MCNSVEQQSTFSGDCCDTAMSILVSLAENFQTRQSVKVLEILECFQSPSMQEFYFLSTDLNCISISSEVCVSTVCIVYYTYECQRNTLLVLQVINRHFY